MDYISKAGRSLAAAILLWLVLGPAALAGNSGNNGMQQVSLGWNASTDPTVTGYYLYYGTASGVYTNKLNVGTNTTVTIPSLVPGATYYFSATSYVAAGAESSYVAEVSYTVPGTLTGTLSVAQNAASPTMCVRFPVAPSQYYQLQASSDLINWTNIWLTPVQTTNTCLEYDEPCNSAIPSKFYRLVLY